MVLTRRRFGTLYIYIVIINLSLKVSSFEEVAYTKYCAANPDNMKSAACGMGINGSSSKKGKSDASSHLNEKSPEERLKEYGYHFKEYDGVRKMMSTEGDTTGFEFDVYDGNRQLNQERYEMIGEIITELVYERLEKELKLEKVFIPVNAKTNDAKGFIFKSSNAINADKLMVLIHGSGVVRAGQWARSLIINHSWESGTMEPYIIQAQEEGFGIIVTNGNHNSVPGKGLIKGSENPQDHFVYIWKHFIKNVKAKDIVVVAHSFGGVVVQHLVRNVPESMKRIKAVAFTDSVHYLGWNEKKEIKHWFRKTTRNWVSSDRPLDEPMTSRYDSSDCDVVSAGTLEHIWTSHYAKDSVFKFINEKLQDKPTKDVTDVPNLEDEAKVSSEDMKMKKSTLDQNSEKEPRDADSAEKTKEVKDEAVKGDEKIDMDKSKLERNFDEEEEKAAEQKDVKEESAPVNTGSGMIKPTGEIENSNVEAEAAEQKDVKEESAPVNTGSGMIKPTGKIENSNVDETGDSCHGTPKEDLKDVGKTAATDDTKKSTEDGKVSGGTSRNDQPSKDESDISNTKDAKPKTGEGMDTTQSPETSAFNVGNRENSNCAPAEKNEGHEKKEDKTDTKHPGTYV